MSYAKEERHAYYLLHKELVAKQSRAWYGSNRDRVLARTKARREADPTKDRRHQIKRLYGITYQEYEAILLAQEGKCKLCKQHMLKPTIEHDHTTKRIRGLVHQKCNIYIGSFESAQKSLPPQAIEKYLGLIPEDTNAK